MRGCACGGGSRNAILSASSALLLARTGTGTGTGRRTPSPFLPHHHQHTHAQLLCRWRQGKAGEGASTRNTRGSRDSETSPCLLSSPPSRHIGSQSVCCLPQLPGRAAIHGGFAPPLLASSSPVSPPIAAVPSRTVLLQCHSARAIPLPSAQLGWFSRGVWSPFTRQAAEF